MREERMLKYMLHSKIMKRKAEIAILLEKLIKERMAQ